MKNKKSDCFDQRKNNKNRKRYLIFFILIVASIGIIKFPSSSPTTTYKDEFSSVDRICELATLRCYYHDVAEYNNTPKGAFKYGLFQYGYKKFWIEYDGIVEYGIDASDVQVNSPDSNDVVAIYVPDAKVLNVTSDENSMSDPIVETGKFTTITTQEKMEAFSREQKSMKENAGKDSALLNSAKENAKVLLKQYVIKVGKQVGKDYTVKWLEKPLDEDKK